MEKSINAIAALLLSLIWANVFAQTPTSLAVLR